MVIFHSYVSLPEGTFHNFKVIQLFQFSHRRMCCFSIDILWDSLHPKTRRQLTGTCEKTPNFLWALLIDVKKIMTNPAVQAVFDYSTMFWTDHIRSLTSHPRNSGGLPWLSHVYPKMSTTISIHTRWGPSAQQRLVGLQTQCNYGYICIKPYKTYSYWSYNYYNYYNP